MSAACKYPSIARRMVFAIEGCAVYVEVVVGLVAGGNVDDVEDASGTYAITRPPAVTICVGEKGWDD